MPLFPGGINLNGYEVNTQAAVTISSFIATLLNDADAATARSTLGLGAADAVIFASVSTPLMGLRDTGTDHYLILGCGENLSANRTLSIVVNNAARALTVAGDATISGTNTGDQTSVTGNAGTVTVADAGGDTTCWVLLGTAQTGSLSPATDSGLTYNANTDTLTTGNITVTGDLTVSGTTTTFDTATVTVEDPLIKLAKANSGHTVDIGLYGLYHPAATDLYAGLFFDATDSKWKLFNGLEAEPTTTVNTAGTGYTVSTLVANLEGNAATVTVADAGGDTTCWILLGTSQTGSLAPATDAGLTYNATTNAITAGVWQGTPVGVAYGGTGGDLSATGGTSQVVKQSSAGAALTVGVLASTDIPQQHNLLCNGGMWYWQRQTPGTDTSYADDAYCADRWYVLTQTTTIQTSRQSGNAGIYAARLTQPQVAAQRMGLAQIVENQDSHPMRGRTLRLQFSAKASTTTTIRFAILEWTGTADSVTSDVVNDWTSSTYTASNFFLGSSLTIPSGSVSSGSATTSFATFSTTATISSSANNLIVMIWTEGTAAQNVTLTIGDVMLCDANLSRDWLPDNLVAELVRCQRYYLKSYAVDTAPGTVSNVGAVGYYAAGTAGEWGPNVTYPVTMRTTPTKTFYSTNTGTSGKKFNASDTADENATANNLEGPNGHTGFTGSHTTNKVYRYHFTASAEL